MLTLLSLQHTVNLAEYYFNVQPVLLGYLKIHQKTFTARDSIWELS